MIFPCIIAVAKSGRLWYDLAMGKKNGENKSKEELREQKRRARAARHIIVCPHCGQDVLDHMTECPHCKGKLVPQGYRPVDAGKYKKIKLISTIVGIAVAIAIAVVIFVTR